MPNDELGALVVRAEEKHSFSEFVDLISEFQFWLARNSDSYGSVELTGVIVLYDNYDPKDLDRQIDLDSDANVVKFRRDYSNGPDDREVGLVEVPIILNLSDLVHIHSYYVASLERNRNEINRIEILLTVEIRLLSEEEADKAFEGPMAAHSEYYCEPANSI
jgi:hypothetical protein